MEFIKIKSYGGEQISVKHVSEAEEHKVWAMIMQHYRDRKGVEASLRRGELIHTTFSDFVIAPSDPESIALWDRMEGHWWQRLRRALGLGMSFKRYCGM